MVSHISKNKEVNLDVIAKKNRYLEIISAVAQSVHNSIDLQTVLDNSIDAMVNNIDHMDNVSIYLVEDDVAVIKAHHGYTKDYLKRAGRIPRPKGATWKTILDAKSRYVPDTEKDDVMGQAGRDMGIKCYLIVPLFDDKKVVGTIIIVSREEKNVFDDEELRLLETVSKQISIAIKNAKQAQALSNSEERYRTLFQEGPSMYFTVDENGVVLTLNRYAIEKLGYSEQEVIGNSVFSVFLDEDIPKIKHQLQECFANPEKIFRWDMRKVCKDGSIISVSELARCVIDDRGKKVVIIACEDTTERQKANSLLLAEKNILEMISEGKHLKEILEYICIAVEQQSDGMLCSFLLADAEGKKLLTRAGPNLPQDYLAATSEVPIGPNIGSCGTASYLKEQVIVSDIEHDPLWADYYDLALRNNLRACWSTPIFSADGYLLGTFAMYYTEPKSPEDKEHDIIERATHLARIAIERKKYEESKEENLRVLSKKSRHEEIISTVTSGVHRSIDINEVFENAAEVLSNNLDHADHVAIYLIDGDEAVLKSHRGYPKWFIDIVERIPKPKGFTWKTLLDGQPRFVADVSKDKAIGPAGRRVGTNSYASMPIKHDNKTIGCINISSRTLHAFDKEEIKLLGIVATQIQTAINNATQAEALKISREQLRNSREHFRLLVETTNVIPWEYNLLANKFTYVGPQVEKLLGYPLSEWLEENFWLSHIHEDDRLYAKEACTSLAQGNGDHELEYRMITKNGDIVWIYEMASVFAKDQEPETLRGFMIDITGRKQVESEKTEAQERYKTLIEHSYDIIIETNANGTFLYINPTFCDVLGYEQQELVGRSIFEHVHEDDAAETIRQFSSAINQFMRGSATYRFKHKSGEWRWLESVGSPFKLATGEIRTVISSRDITERMESEKKLHSALSEIEELKDKLEKENVYLQKELELTLSHGGILGESTAIKSALAKIEQVAKTDSTVLITGETGTGKELFANRLHVLSERSDRAMVKVNCAALPPHLIESELFGHEKGAFTGAVARSIGRFEVADGSTIFLDEVGELPLELQSKLLRVLQEGEFERLGSSKTMEVNVRVIAASNQALIEAVKKGSFREDLYYRLNVFPIHIPPLRERKEDIPDLLWFFISEFEEKMDKQIKNISRKDMENLINYPWPGNVRQLRNVIERSMIISQGPDLLIDLPGITNDTPVDMKPIEEVERNHISYILNMTNWRIRGKTGAAEILGLKPTTLESRIKKLGIKRGH